MSEDPFQRDLLPAHVVARERCIALGLPTWRFGASGGLLSKPSEGGLAGSWLRGAFVTRLITKAARAWSETEEVELQELFPGCWLIPMEERQRRRRVSLTVAMGLSPEALEGPTFVAGCESTLVDIGATREAMGKLACFDEGAIRRLAEVLEWMHDDLVRLGTGDTSIESLSRQLSESYEEMSLLYNLREYMSELAHPKRFVRQACFELHEVLPYSWVAATFVDDQRRSRGLAGSLVSSGEPPCGEARLRATASELIDAMCPGTCLTLDGEERGALARGTSQVLAFPISREGEVIGAFFVGDKAGGDDEVTNIELKMIEAAGGYVSILIENAGLYEDQHAMYMGTLRALTASIDAKDPYTRGHSERVADLAADLARAHGLPDAMVERVRISGLVHDIGKIGISEDVLRKPGRLTEEEFEQMKTHPEIGHRILQGIPHLDDVLPGVLHHHERYDGRGYPHGLVGEDIPLVARILALADSFDAMSSTRTYRAAMSRECVLAEVRACAGAQFDSELAERFVKLDFSGYDAAVRRHRNSANGGDEQSRGVAA